MKILTTALLSAVFACGFAIAQDKPVENTTDKPEQVLPTKPEDRKVEIERLIGQLGADSPKTRQHATEMLRKFGKDALPALAEARKNEDLEVATRATAISKQIEDDAAPKPVVTPNNLPGRGRVMRLGNGNVHIQIQGGGGVAIAGGGAFGVNGHAMTITRQENNGVKDTTATEGDRTVSIHEDAEGITMTVTQKNDGKDASKEYKAKDAETLKKDHPEAHALYEKYNGNGGMIRIDQLNVGPGMLELPEIVIPDIEQEQLDVHKQMEMARKQMEEMRRMMQERRNGARREIIPQRADEAPKANIEPELKKRLDDLNKELNLERQRNDELRQQMLKEIEAAKKELESIRAKAEEAKKSPQSK